MVSKVESISLRNILLSLFEEGDYPKALFPYREESHRNTPATTANTNRITPKRAIPVRSTFSVSLSSWSIVSYPIRFSALTEGALVSGLQGKPEPGSSHHQIMTHPRPSGKSARDHLMRLLEFLPSLKFAYTGLRRVRKREKSPSPHPIRACSARLWVRGGSSSVFIKMKTLTQILRAKGIVTKDDFRAEEGFSKNSTDRSTRVGAKPERERPVAWNSRRAHKVHPYWSHNLKYGF